MRLESLLPFDREELRSLGEPVVVPHRVTISDAPGPDGDDDTSRFVTEFVTNAARLVGTSDAESDLLERLEDSLQRAVSPAAENRDFEWLRVYFAVSRIVPLVPSRLRGGTAYRDMQTFLNENVDMLHASA